MLTSHLTIRPTKNCMGASAPIAYTHKPFMHKLCNLFPMLSQRCTWAGIPPQFLITGQAAMFLMACFFVLLILSPTTGTGEGTGSECKMYVSSFDGINDNSCWTGGYQTPCASLDLALQATTHGNCSSSSIIYLYPGDYTLDLDTTTTREKHNNVKDVSIRVQVQSPHPSC